jgi:hypothetical protein
MTFPQKIYLYIDACDKDDDDPDLHLATSLDQLGDHHHGQPVAVYTLDHTGPLQVAKTVLARKER